MGQRTSFCSTQTKANMPVKRRKGHLDAHTTRTDTAPAVLCRLLLRVHMWTEGHSPHPHPGPWEAQWGFTCPFSSCPE